MQIIRPVTTQVTWLRARDLAPPDSVTRGGPFTGVTGPVVDVLFLIVMSLVGAAGAVYSLAHLSVPGFIIMGLFTTVPGYAGWVRFQQASAPAMGVGAGGVWLAGTDQRAGDAIPWSNVAELVFFTARERRVGRTGVRRYRALGVRLRVPRPIPAQERARLEQVLDGLPQVRDQVLESVRSWEEMPYRQIGGAGRLERAALTRATIGFAPWVEVVTGPRLDSLMPWVVGEAEAEVRTGARPLVTGGLLPGLLSVLGATPREPATTPPDQPPSAAPPTAPSSPAS